MKGVIVLIAFGMAGFALAGETISDIAAVVATKHPDWDVSGHQARHEERLKVAREGGAPIVFLGDDLVEDFEIRHGRVAWEKYFMAGRYRSLNLGFSADRTENAIWRIGNGELSGFQAKAVVLEVGTRNLERSGETVIDTILGVRALVRRVQELQPQAKIILHPILPRGEAGGLERQQREAVNKELKWLADGKDVWWCDFNEQLLTADGRLLREISQDGVRLLAYGYEVWANAILPYLDAALDWNADDGRMMPARLPTHVDPKVFGNKSLAVESQSIIGHSYPWEGHKGWWLDKVAEHRQQVALSGGSIDVVFLGDSITDNWDRGGGEELARIRKEFSVMNLGYSGDSTQHLLWRIRNGELDGYRAKVIVLLIGVNNLFWDGEANKPENVVDGIQSVLETVRMKQPQAKVILHPLLPCEYPPNHPVQVGRARVNELLRPLADGTTVLWCNMNVSLAEQDGTPLKIAYADHLHINREGYSIWSRMVLPIIRKCVSGCR